MNVFFATLARLIDIKNGSLRQKKKLPEELSLSKKVASGGLFWYNENG